MTAPRAKKAEKCGADGVKVTFDDALAASTERSHDLVALDDALEALARFDVRKSRVVELRYFAGLTVEETACVLQVSPDTVSRDWKLAKAWLLREIEGA